MKRDIKIPFKNIYVYRTNDGTVMAKFVIYEQDGGVVDRFSVSLKKQVEDIYGTTEISESIFLELAHKIESSLESFPLVLNFQEEDDVWTLMDPLSRINRFLVKI